jgi:hypothetical protein
VVLLLYGEGVPYPHSERDNLENTLNGKHAGEADVHVAKSFLVHSALLVILEQIVKRTKKKNTNENK